MTATAKDRERGEALLVCVRSLLADRRAGKHVDPTGVLAEALAEERERAATFVERDFDPGSHEAVCPHPESACTCLLSEVARAIRGQS